MSDLTVLYVEDNEQLRRAFKEYLEERGAAVTTCPDSQIAEAFSQPSAYDVFVAHSIDAVKTVRKRAPKTPVILMSGDITERRYEAECQTIAVDAWVDKGHSWPQDVLREVEALAKKTHPDSNISMRRKSPNPPPCLLESYEGDVVESHGGTVVVIYEVGDDEVEQIYEQEQFVDGRLPSEGARLRVRVEVTELPTSKVKTPEKIITEPRDDPGNYGPDKLTEPIDF